MSRPSKRARTAQEAIRAPTSYDLGGLGGLYDFLPPADEVKTEKAKDNAKKVPDRAPLPAQDRTRVIFLDVDGVLLASGSVEMITVDGCQIPKHNRVKPGDFSSQAMGALRRIVEKTGAGIVLSSEWRRTEELRSSIQAVLKDYGLPVFRGFTTIYGPKPELQRQHPVLAWCERRAREISRYLKDNQEVTSWVALDDLDFAMADSVRAAGTSWIKIRSVLTDMKICMTDADADKAVEILMNPPVDPRQCKVMRAAADEATSALLCSTEDSAPERLRLG